MSEDQGKRVRAGRLDMKGPNTAPDQAGDWKPHLNHLQVTNCTIWTLGNHSVVISISIESETHILFTRISDHSVNSKFMVRIYENWFKSNVWETFASQSRCPIPFCEWFITPLHHTQYKDWLVLDNMDYGSPLYFTFHHIISSMCQLPAQNVCWLNRNERLYF